MRRQNIFRARADRDRRNKVLVVMGRRGIGIKHVAEESGVGLGTAEHWISGTLLPTKWDAIVDAWLEKQ